MSYNIGSIDIIKGSLHISKRNAKKAAKLDLPEGHNFERDDDGVFIDLRFGEDGRAEINPLWFYGEGSGNAYTNGVFEALMALLEGEADLVLTWEDGDSHTGARVRSGKTRECGVKMVLEDEDE